jgi:hypothetical protein
MKPEIFFDFSQYLSQEYLILVVLLCDIWNTSELMCSSDHSFIMGGSCQRDERCLIVIDNSVNVIPNLPA